jgi:hypothetical protein
MRQRQHAGPPGGMNAVIQKSERDLEDPDRSAAEEERVFRATTRSSMK